MSGLQRVPGVKRYRALDEGLKIIGSSSGMSEAATAAASRLAAQANVAGKDSYRATPRTVRAGWRHEGRAGAAVSASGADLNGADRDVLRSVIGLVKLAPHGPVDNPRARAAQKQKGRTR